MVRMGDSANIYCRINNNGSAYAQLRHNMI